MANVRSLLRAERANRRIAHPNASYSSDGKLRCNLCELPVKNEAAWSGHLHSTQHTLRSTRVQDVAVARPDGSSKKRKAESLDAPRSPEEKKRVKPAPALQVREDDVLDKEEDEASAEAILGQHEQQISILQGDNSLAQSKPVVEELNDVDEDEIAAFERELAALEAEQNASASALNAAATISAAPITAEEIAAQAREEQSAQRGQRDAEIEGEREDAARLLEEEFEEMEGLEERVKKLRERREALRKGSVTETDAGGIRPLVDDEVDDAKGEDALVGEDGEEDNDDDWFGNW